jgi:hypothetical protein
MQNQFCPKCGSQNAGGAAFCAVCGNKFVMEPQAAGGAPMPNIDNHMAFAIFTMLCCCTPLGIVAVVYASQVNGKMRIGDYAGALSSANNAKNWCWISIVCGVILTIVVIVGNILSR